MYVSVCVCMCVCITDGKRILKPHLMGGVGYNIDSGIRMNTSLKLTFSI